MNENEVCGHHVASIEVPPGAHMRSWGWMSALVRAMREESAPRRNCRKVKRYSDVVTGRAVPPIARMTRIERDSFANGMVWSEIYDAVTFDPERLPSDSEVSRKATSLGRPRRSRQVRSGRWRAKDRVAKRTGS